MGGWLCKGFPRTNDRLELKDAETRGDFDNCDVDQWVICVYVYIYIHTYVQYIYSVYVYAYKYIYMQYILHMCNN